MVNGLKHQLDRLFKLLGGEEGFSLVESLISIAVLGVAVSTFIGALSTGSIIVGELNHETVAQQLAQSQIEQTKAIAYSTTGAGYTIISAPAGYSVAMAVDSALYTNSNIQKLTVTVSRDAVTVLTVEDYKVQR